MGCADCAARPYLVARAESRPYLDLDRDTWNHRVVYQVACHILVCLCNLESFFDLLAARGNPAASDDSHSCFAAYPDAGLALGTACPFQSLAVSARGEGCGPSFRRGNHLDNHLCRYLDDRVVECHLAVMCSAHPRKDHHADYNCWHVLVVQDIVDVRACVAVQDIGADHACVVVFCFVDGCHVHSLARVVNCVCARWADWLDAGS